ncbi:MAG: bifunctional glutamate N-acetyltransferase/amino-acid acetyltransferase ArgJ [Eubacterium sp.]|nr:bifunctional glutamate N-acetyltransferase/amino-acid acetyltransferase ArgJ [Eubacterium sp.]
MQKITGGITAAAGFMAASTAAGIKKEDRQDMAMVCSTVPCTVAGTFTTNLVKAAPVKWDQRIVQESENAQAIVINSGIANACTGQEGMDSCERTAEAAAEILKIRKDAVLVASTGVIGQPLPTNRIIKGVRQMAPCLSEEMEAGAAAAKAIMTTDTVPKETAVSFEVDGKTATLGGMCKGSGMIHPNMCTMLAFLTTDVSISKELLQEALSDLVQDTFNMISVDGDTSTNDTVLLLANGLAGNTMITEKDAGYDQFLQALRQVMTILAKKIASDGEGASKLFEAVVEGASTVKQAKILAKSIIMSNLSKAAMFGADANWGRILCAMGYAGVAFDPDKVDLWFESPVGKIGILKDGILQPYSEEKATAILSAEEVRARADIHEGDCSAVAWGCDLTYDYVKINADYRS